MDHPLTEQEWKGVKGRRPHILAVPFPAQGHVRPLMKFSQQIANHGIKVTFVNTEYIHAKVVAAMSEEDEKQRNIELISIPDGLMPDDDRNNGFIINSGHRKTLLRNLTNLMEKLSCDEKISCVIADISIGWILDDIEKMEAVPVAFLTGAAAEMALTLHIPKLIEAENVDVNGTMMQNELILSDEIPSWRTNELIWSVPADLNAQKLFFEFFRTAERSAHHAKWLLCNTFHEIESSACKLIPKICPVGPLLSGNNLRSSASGGSFWVEDTSCLSWLDNQQVGSVIYVSFGSVAVFSQDQLNELASGLELSSRPFLWVVRSNLANGLHAEYPNGFLERVAERAKIVEWASQEQVLAHSSVGCFLSHCGWNSTVEGLSMGIPFLCWPYFADQFHNQNYICAMWKIGLSLNPNESGLRSRHEIKTKIEMLFADYSIKANALKLKDLALKSVSESGSSFRNFETFVDHLKK
ncbi:UDP-glycosyltransferase 83A1-like [Olea europaea subsp. europaea]|uniref:UDP-glycosyltransferase 83A1-like n=1 Tax=Olea europaea subsp. europaea TaxID=158383 RepID=A0A8S0UG76_OLEEU|nr:UDP-glycosyltransferase 83A1-like [Olea europaea subsp. europaea]